MPTLPKIVDSMCNVESKDPENVARVVRTLVVMNNSNDVIEGCNKLIASLKGRASSELQSSKPFKNSGKPGKVVGIFERGRTHKPWH